MTDNPDSPKVDAHHHWLVGYKVEIGEKRIYGIMLASGIINHTLASGLLSYLSPIVRKKSHIGVQTFSVD